MRVTELADRVRQRVKESGLPIQVIEVAGWQTRGYEFPVRPKGALRHWTAVGGTGRTTSLGAVTNGRTSPTPLAGPLSELYQSRNLAGYDDIYVIASGKANHAGEGEWNGIKPGNYQVLGLEIEWAGPSEVFPARRVIVSEIAMRALLDCTSGEDDDVCEHREWALPRGRKIDTSLDGNKLRQRMTELRVASTTPQVLGEDDMKHFRPILAATHPDVGKTFLVVGNIRFHVPSQSYHDQLVVEGYPADEVNAWAWDCIRAATFGSPDELINRIAEKSEGSLQDDFQKLLDGLKDVIVRELASSDGGDGVSTAQVEAAVVKGITETGLIGLLPGK